MPWFSLYKRVLEMDLGDLPHGSRQAAKTATGCIDQG